MGNSIRCDLGHCLDAKSGDGSVSVRRLAWGAGLTYAVCQKCPDFESMGPPVLREERGWLKIQSTSRNPYGRRGKPPKDE